MKFEGFFEGVFLALILLGLTLTGVMADGESEVTDNITIDVEIGVQAQIELNETVGIDFGTVQPTQNSSIEHLRVTNTGSTTIDQVWADVDTLTLNSVNARADSSSSTDWAATGFVGLANATSGVPYYYVGKLAWNYSNDEDSSGFTFAGGSADAWGEFWGGGSSKASHMYYWELDGAAGDCAAAGTALRISSQGSQDTSAGTTLLNEAQNAGYAAFTANSGPWQNYCIYTASDCSYIYISRWSRNSTFPSCSNQSYIYPSSFGPGSYFDFAIKAIIPPQIQGGATATTKFTVWADSDHTA
jgi:hypothetical protein